MPFIGPTTVDSRRLIVTVCFVLLTGFGIWEGGQFLEARSEYLHHLRVQAAVEGKLTAARARLAEQDQTLHRLKTDPVFVEKVLRENLKYARPGEVIFRFPTQK